jgi:hypothetical protein
MLVEFGVLTAVAMKGFIFWNMMLCNPVNQLTIQRNTMLPSSGLSMKLYWLCKLVLDNTIIIVRIIFKTLFLLHIFKTLIELNL